MANARELSRALSLMEAWAARAALLGGRAAPGHLLLEPQAVVLTGPVLVHLAPAHGLEGALHTDGADVDVGQHDSDEGHADYAVHHLCQLHAGDVGGIEGEHQEVAGD